MNSKPKIIVITGAESTGKSTLTEALARHFNAPFIPEIARNYVEKLNRHYNYEDVEKIAEVQVEQLKRFKDTDHPYIFLDTWLVITKIWFEVVYDKIPNWFETEMQKTPIDLFLVCQPDLPWKPDSVRENGGKQRILLHKKYIETIKKYNYKYAPVDGSGNERIKNALTHLNYL